MVVKCIVKKNTFYDSIRLMRIASELSRKEGVDDVAVLMGTNQNKASIADGDLYVDEVKNATANDLFISVKASTEELADAIIAEAESMIANAGDRNTEITLPTAYSLNGALQQASDANIALLSLPGIYIKDEALKALEEKLNLMIFSDNVPIEDELLLKKKGKDAGLLVMGPDCGTAIINGTALAFANAVRKGKIGVVGASGTGIQEVTSIIHDLGEGISHAIGTGSRDVKKDIGGIMTIEGLKRLDANNETEVIVVVSKPPEEEVMSKIIDTINSLKKPVVLLLLGATNLPEMREGCHIACTMEEAAVLAVALLRKCPIQNVAVSFEKQIEQLGKEVDKVKAKLKAEQKYIRGIFTGGTLASEAALVMTESLNEVYSNTSTPGCLQLTDPLVSEKHCCVDMGEDTFTRGRPHPMIEPSMRHKRIIQEAVDPETRVMIFDVVIGYGSHPDPAGALCESLLEVSAMNKSVGKTLPVIAYVCGVEDDPQVKSVQEQKLRDAGCIVAPSSSAAVKLAKMFL